MDRGRLSSCIYTWLRARHLSRQDRQDNRNKIDFYVSTGYEPFVVFPLCNYLPLSPFTHCCYNSLCFSDLCYYARLLRTATTRNHALQTCSSSITTKCASRPSGRVGRTGCCNALFCKIALPDGRSYRPLVQAECSFPPPPTRKTSSHPLSPAILIFTPSHAQDSFSPLP